MINVWKLRCLGPVLLCAVVGCKVKAQTHEGVERATVQKNQKVVQKKAATIEEQAKLLVEKWRVAQLEHDSIAYKSFYSVDGFKGVKRKSNGEITKYEYDGWLFDRLGTLNKIKGLAVEGVSVKTWNQDTRLGKGIVRIRFLQRWRSARYSDHGEKMLLLHYRFGKLRIVYEDLLNAESGWGKERVTKILLTSIEDKKQAQSFWENAKLSGRNVDRFLFQIYCEDDCSLIASAVFDLGDLSCTEVIATEEECGQMTGEARAPLRAKADLGDPCLRRRIAAWAVEKFSDEGFDLRRPFWEALAGDGYYDPLHEAIYRRILEKKTKLATSDLLILKKAVDANHLGEGAFPIDGILDSKKVELFVLGHQPSGFLIKDETLTDAALDVLLRGKSGIDAWEELFTRFSSLFSIAQLQSLLAREPDRQALVIEELLNKGVKSALPPSSSIAEAEENFEVLYYLNRAEHLVTSFTMTESRMVEELTDKGWEQKESRDTSTESELPNLSNPDIESWDIDFEKKGAHVVVKSLDIELTPAYGCDC